MNDKLHCKQNIDLLDVLLDVDNFEPLTLYNEWGRALHFEQVAVIPHVINGKKYCFALLAPLDDFPDIAKDEAIVFRVALDERGEAILVLPEQDAAEEVFAIYDAMCKQREKQIANEKNTKGDDNND